jgi:hypothetical protein
VNLSALKRSFDRFFLAESGCTAVVVFRFGFGLWSLCFWAVRLPHIWELYCRPILRPALPPVHWFGGFLLPEWLATSLVALVLLLVLGFVFSARPRRFHLALFAPLCVLYAYEGRNAGAYGVLAFIVWWLLLLVPYDRWRDRKGCVRQVPITGQRLLALQWSSIYLFTVAAKVFEGSGWLDGTALWRALHSQHTGQFLLSALWDVPLWFCQLAGWGAMMAEVFVGLGVWFVRTRRPAMVVCVLLHTTMALTLNISPLFHSLMVLHLILFIDERFWLRLSRRLPFGFGAKHSDLESAHHDRAV